MVYIPPLAALFDICKNTENFDSTTERRLFFTFYLNSFLLQNPQAKGRFLA